MQALAGIFCGPEVLLICFARGTRGAEEVRIFGLRGLELTILVARAYLHGEDYHDVCFMFLMIVVFGVVTTNLLMI